MRKTIIMMMIIIMIIITIIIIIKDENSNKKREKIDPHWYIRQEIMLFISKSSLVQIVKVRFCYLDE